MRRKRVAVVLFNLGGPDGPDDVKPFLHNLFRDPAIISAPGPVREALAWFISTSRASSSRENYALIGGGSPIYRETHLQAEALQAALDESDSPYAFKVFIAMRYWRPFIRDVAREVREWKPHETVLLPLYPQFSTTTTGSSLTAWRRAAPDLPTRTVCCYPKAEAFIDAHAKLIEQTWRDGGAPKNARVLFSAHGLPERVIQRGDPYQWQIERTVEAVAERLPEELSDRVICYQSRVGPLKWIGPSTDEEIKRAGADGRAVVLTPIAFVSEHVETLVELDHEYAELAAEHDVTAYLRVPALGVASGYIDTLRDLTLGALEGEPGMKPPNGQRLCRPGRTSCPCALDSEEAAASAPPARETSNTAGAPA
ncbi:MAG: ferrochelatase [Maricaulaceae bacterium]